MSDLKNKNQIQVKPKTMRRQLQKSSLQKSGLGYFSKVKGDLTEADQDRLRNAKSNTTKVKKDGMVNMEIYDNKIIIKHSKEFINNKEAAGEEQRPIIEGAEYQNKRVKKYEMMVEMKTKSFVKEQDYFDEEEEPEHHGQLNRTHFDMGQFDSFETFNVKTYLFDRNLNRKIKS